jgi:hypothetical protein
MFLSIALLWMAMVSRWNDHAEQQISVAAKSKNRRFILFEFCF